MFEKVLIIKTESLLESQSAIDVLRHLRERGFTTRKEGEEGVEVLKFFLEKDLIHHELIRGEDLNALIMKELKKEFSNHPQLKKESTIQFFLYKRKEYDDVFRHHTRGWFESEAFHERKEYYPRFLRRFEHFADKSDEEILKFIREELFELVFASLNEYLDEMEKKYGYKPYDWMFIEMKRKHPS